jgi:tRNA A37 N6-isopentenylltransferase MiaA
VIATRQLAKRQMTWLRAERGAVRLCSDDPCLLSKALASLADEPRGMSR